MGVLRRLRLWESSVTMALHTRRRWHIACKMILLTYATMQLSRLGTWAQRARPLRARSKCYATTHTRRKWHRRPSRSLPHELSIERFACGSSCANLAVLDVLHDECLLIGTLRACVHLFQLSARR